ncbi:lytic transglycosylase domain-containing protein [Paracoccus pacificus]|uniref:Lytic transglycosylase domain-containing protein n=1 Tax=Paracoccus pacificus TaxID=1463598 RepID=A0ABW4R748_9RHOB
MVLFLAVVVGIGPMPGAARPAIDALNGTPPPPLARSDDRRCRDDGTSCIARATYVPDVCLAIARAAGENDLDPNFLARLLWKESLFDPSAVSPAGALGIAQFIPSTAQIVGLDDPMNPAKAIHKSARYLAELSREFGNIGLAAVAYNGGEDRAARFKEKGGALPFETEDYVQAITGRVAEEWRSAPPETLDLRLKKDTPFHLACVELAGARKIKEFATPDRIWPWGVIIASHPSRAGAQKSVNRLSRMLRPILGGRKVSYVRTRMPGMPRRVHTAQVGWDNKVEAVRFCAQFRLAGGRCLVLKN